MKGCRRFTQRQPHRVAAVALFALVSTAMPVSAQNTYPSNGNVGIGTMTPTQPLTIQTSGDTRFRLLSGASSGRPWDFTSGGGGSLGAGYFAIGDATAGQQRFVIDTNGNVGIGTTNPTRTLTIATGIDTKLAIVSGAVGGRYWDIASGGGGVLSAGFFGIGDATAGQQRFVIDTKGYVGIGTIQPAAQLHIAGNAQVDGNIAAKYQDVAEWVKSSGNLPAATVVIIDSLEADRVVISNKAYDTKVAGVVSSKPGLLLGEGGEDKVKVAHSGRVRVMVDATEGPIAVGDLLVTSPRPGYAMRSDPITIGGAAIHRPGTLIGKALESLDSGQGEILILLTLQ